MVLIISPVQERSAETLRYHFLKFCSTCRVSDVRPHLHLRCVVVRLLPTSQLWPPKRYHVLHIAESRLPKRSKSEVISTLTESAGALLVLKIRNTMTIRQSWQQQVILVDIRGEIMNKISCFHTKNFDSCNS